MTTPERRNPSTDGINTAYIVGLLGIIIVLYRLIFMVYAVFAHSAPTPQELQTDIIILAFGFLMLGTVALGIGVYIAFQLWVKGKDKV